MANLIDHCFNTILAATGPKIADPWITAAITRNQIDLSTRLILASRLFIKPFVHVICKPARATSSWSFVIFNVGQF